VRVRRDRPAAVAPGSGIP